MKNKILTYGLLSVLTISSLFGAPVFAKTKKTTDTINYAATSNFDRYNNTDNSDTEDTYVLNTKTKKIHDPDCKSVKKIKKANYATSSESVTTLKEEGYTICGQCLGKK